MFNVQVLYRNYIPLNSPYSSFWLAPPEGINFRIPATKAYLRHLYPIYRNFSDYSIVRWGVHAANKFVFSSAAKEDDCDAYFYVGIIPDKAPDRPFYVDIEHAAALSDFVEGEEDEARRQVDRALEVLMHPNCKAVVPISSAAGRSLVKMLENRCPEIESKIKVIYPSLARYDEIYQADPKHIRSSDDEINIVFIGREPVRKGLLELLEAARLLVAEGLPIKLSVVTEPKNRVLDKFRDDEHLTLYPCSFSTEEVMSYFMLPADVFVMPTHSDSFGMVYLEALSSGTPVIATSQFAIPEIVDHGVNGVLLEHPPLFLDRPDFENPKRPEDLALDADLSALIIERLVVTIRQLVSDRDQLRRFSEHSSKEFREGGRFSIGHRNAELRDLFLNA